MRPVHKRTNAWDGIAFTSLDEVADFIEAMEAVVGELGSKIDLRITVDCGDRAYSRLTLDELRALSEEVPLDTLVKLSAFTAFDDNQPANSRLFLFGRRGIPKVSTHLDISGASGGAVDGANVQGKAAMEKQFKEQGKAKAPARDAAGWKRLLNHPWSVQIGGGVIAALIVAFLFVLLHWP